MRHIHSMLHPALLGWVLAAAAGCGQQGPPRAAVAGLVTVGGQPLVAGRILFTPIAPTEGPAVSARIQDGKYQLTKAEGPILGQNGVQVEADLDLGFALDDEAAYAKRGKPLPPNPVPPEFNVKSVLVADVKSGEKNTFNIAIPGTRQTVSRPLP